METPLTLTLVHSAVVNHVVDDVSRLVTVRSLPLYVQRLGFLMLGETEMLWGHSIWSETTPYTSTVNEQMYNFFLKGQKHANLRTGLFVSSVKADLEFALDTIFPKVSCSRLTFAFLSMLSWLKRDNDQVITVKRKGYCS